jgi:glycosyltransferase involved in cell wall biosynthesis
MQSNIMNTPIKKKICIISTVSLPIKVFISPQIVALLDDFDVSIVASHCYDELNYLSRLGVTLKSIDISRKISPVADLLALIQIYYLLSRKNFDVVHTIMPKSGLIGMIAARLAGVKLRVHTFTGQVWATKTGLSKFLLKNLDRVLALSASHLLADSNSQKDFLIGQGIVNRNKISILADGSISGVDAVRFCPNPEIRSQIRSSLQIKNDEILLLFLGRLKKDKGILDLLEAFRKIALNYSNIHLCVIGPDEENIESLLEEVSCLFGGRVHRVGYTDLPEHYMAASDIFCLPSYREGFGNVIIESAAVGIPSVASKIYGLIDSVEDGITGLLHVPGDVDDLTKKILQLAMDKTLRDSLGIAARNRAVQKFSQELLTSALIGFYSGKT